MTEEHGSPNRLIDTTDCLEAVGVFRGWKNFLFLIVFSFVLLLQVSFWLVDTGCIKADDGSAKTAPATAEANKELQDSQTTEIKKAAEIVVAGANEPNNIKTEQPEQKKKKINLQFNLTLSHLEWLTRLFNFALIPAAILYCLTMLFSLKISMLGRLGGINHISRAFFLSLVMLILLLPWQILFDGVFCGVIYIPKEMINACQTIHNASMFDKIIHYGRFTGYWLLAMLFLLLSQYRSGRWAKTILRRLEVI